MDTNKQTWEIGKENASDVIATLDGTTLTIDGKGEMRDFSIIVYEERDTFSYAPGVKFFGDPRGMIPDGRAQMEIVSVEYDDSPVFVVKYTDDAPWSQEIISNVHITGVSNIGDCAFLDLYGLKSITISDSVNRIGAWAFKNCRTLESIQIPRGIQILQNDVFRGCRALESVEMPESVKNINNGAFRGCSNLKTVICPSRTLPNLSPDAFFTDLDDLDEKDAFKKIEGGDLEERNAFKKVKLYVPAVSIDYYKNAPRWEMFEKFGGKIHAIEDLA